MKATDIFMVWDAEMWNEGIDNGKYTLPAELTFEEKIDYIISAVETIHYQGYITELKSKFLNEYILNEDNHLVYDELHNEIVDLPMFDKDFNEVNFPETAGLYLLGQISHDYKNPSIIYHMVKVGSAENIRSRVKAYHTYAPYNFEIDYCLQDDTPTRKRNEKRCHAVLSHVATARGRKSSEWFLVDADTYAEICEKGFKYFDL